MISLKIWEALLSLRVNCFLPVAVRVSRGARGKTSGEAARGMGRALCFTAPLPILRGASPLVNLPLAVVIPAAAQATSPQSTLNSPLWADGMEADHFLN